MRTVLVCLSMLALCLPVSLYAQEEPEPEPEPKPYVVSPVNSTEGYDFYVAWLLNGKEENAKLQLLIATRTVPGHDEITTNEVRVEYADGTSQDFSIPLGSDKVIEINSDKVLANTTIGEEEKVLDKKGVRVYSKNKVKMSVYSTHLIGSKGTFRFDGAHVLPREALGQEYIVQTNKDDATATEFVVMSVSPGETNVKLSLPVPSRLGKKQELEFKFTNAKQIYLVRSDTLSDEGSTIDLSGATICADKPVAVWTGNQETLIPRQQGMTADHAYDQLLPLNKWGKQFIVPMTTMEVLSIYLNRMRITALSGGTKVTCYKGTTKKELQFNSPGHTQDIDMDGGVYYLTATKPVQVYLFSSSAGYNTNRTSEGLRLPSNPSMTLIPPLEYLTDTAVFTTYAATDVHQQAEPGKSENLAHRVSLWVTKGKKSMLRLDGEPLPATVEFSDVQNTNFAQASFDLPSLGNHVFSTTDGSKAFGGYAYGLAEGQAYLYPLNYSFEPVHDSLFLIDKAVNGKPQMEEYSVPRSEWKKTYAGQGGWYLNRDITSEGETILDSVFVCDSTTLQFPLYLHNDWDSVKWQVIGSLQKEFVLPFMQGKGDVKNGIPLLDTLFNVQPEKEFEPHLRHRFEDFEVRAVVYHHPVLCEQENVEKWRKDTFNTIVRVQRNYNDTVWQFHCTDDKFQYFREWVDPDDPDVADWDGRTWFYYEADEAIDAIPDDPYHPRKKKFGLGPQEFQRNYLTLGGCDSTSTLMIYVCKSKHNTKEISMCDAELRDLNDELGDFFSKGYNTELNIDFEQSFRNRAANNLWKLQPDGSYYFEQTSKLKIFTCFDETDELMRQYLEHARYDGCDSTLTLKLTVYPADIRIQNVSICASKYDWYNDDGVLIRTIQRDATNTNKIAQYTESYPFKTGGCDSVRYELDLMFVDGDLVEETVNLCANSKPVTMTHLGETWTFNPAAQGEISTETDFPGEQKPFSTTDGCNYNFRYVFHVSPLTEHRDSVVVCYPDNGRTMYVPDRWVGHESTGWIQEVGKPKQRYTLITTTFPSKNQPRKIFVMSDTTRASSGCDHAWYKVIILMPPYDEHSEANISNEDTYEWAGTLLVGDKAQYTNPKQLPVVKLIGENTQFRSDWEGVYDPEKMEYRIHTTYHTKPIPANSTHYCDSIVSLTLGVGVIYRDTTYAHACSADKVYSWRNKNWELPQVTSVKEIFFSDTLKTKGIVKDLDSIQTLSMTVFPSYSKTKTVTECQSYAGYKWSGHMGGAHQLYMDGVLLPSDWDTIPTSAAGHYTVVEYLKTKPRDFRHPRLDTLIESGVVCDSIWTLDLTVNPSYNLDFNTIMAERTLKSNDTLTFFSKPKMLFIGKDFDYAAHGGKTKEQLRREAGAGKYFEVKKDTLYPQINSSQLGCDSISYLQINLCMLVEKSPTVKKGDNDSVWVFGGDTTRNAAGERKHTLPKVTVRDLNQLDGVEPIDYTSEGRRIRTHSFTDTMQTVNGCDSIVHMTVKIYPTYRFVEKDSTCHDERYDWRGQEYLNATLITDEVTGFGYAYDSLKTAAGFDSVYVLALHIFPYEDIGNSTSAPKQLCYNDTLRWQGNFIHYDPELEIETEEITHRYKDPNYRCGRTYTLTVNYVPSYGYNGAGDYNDWVDVVDNICQYDEFHWYNYRHGGNGEEHTRNLRDPQGNKLDTIPTDVPGWHVIYDSLKTTTCGCDSIYTLRYFVNKAYEFPTEVALCTDSTYYWYIDGRYYNSYPAPVKKDIVDTVRFTASSGCDSIYTLYVHVDSTYEYPLDTVVCWSRTKHFTWNGRSYDAELEASREWLRDSVFRDTLWGRTAFSGCDSIVYLTMTIPSSRDSVWTDTLCIGETVYFVDGTPLTHGGEYSTYHWLDLDPGCYINYILNLVEYPPTKFDTLYTDPVCVNQTGTENDFKMHYRFTKGVAPISYSITFDSAAHAAGFRDKVDIPIDIPDQKPGVEYEVNIPLEYMDATDYPEPRHYRARIGFKNGVCEGDELMADSITFTMNYPESLLQVLFGNVIALYDSVNNGGYKWASYQWYYGDEKLSGETNSYLYVPGGLHEGDQYHVELTVDGDSAAFKTCPIYITYHDTVSTAGASPFPYLDVVPTCVAMYHPYVKILSSCRNGKGGTYRISTTCGRVLSKGEFKDDVTVVQVPQQQGMYIFQLWTPDIPEEPYRAVKIVVKEKCEMCDISSF